MPSHGRDWTPPGRVTMDDFVETITKILDAQDEPVVLVAHSRGGLVTTQVAEVRPDKIHRSVCLAAVLLPNGVRLLDRPDKQSSLQIDFDTKAG